MTSKTVPGAAATAYPRRLDLRGGAAISMRPMTYEDADALHQFFCRIPEDDLLFLRRDVTDRDVIQSWAEDVARERTFTLLAELDGTLIGEASVHRSGLPWTAHIGEIRVVVDAGQRQSGLGSTLVQAIFLESLERGIEKIVAEMTPDQTGAVAVFQKLGFRTEGLFRDHVRDRRGGKHDLIVMSHDVHEANERLAHLGITAAVEAKS